MLKKIIPIIFILCLILKISVMAENTTDSNVLVGTAQEMPVHGGEKPQDRYQGMLFEMPNDVNIVFENDTQISNSSPEQNGQFLSDMQGGFPSEIENNNQTTEIKQSTGIIEIAKIYSTPITSVILLALAFVFVIFYKKRSY